MVVGFGLSWSAVYSFWYAAQIFGSVQAVRVCESLAVVILLPVRLLFRLMGGLFDQTAPLTSPLYYAAVNGVLLGIIGHGVCRQWLCATKPRAE
jgi:hypothetical protein